MATGSPGPRRAGVLFGLLLALLALGLATTGFLAYRSFRLQLHAQAERQLSAIAELKVGELSRWRHERLGDGSLLAGDPVLCEMVERWLDRPGDATTGAKLRTWLTRARSANDYERAAIVNASGQSLLTVPDARGAADPDLPATVAEALRSARVAFVDLHRDASDTRGRMAVVAPLFGVGGRPLGAIVLSIDPTTFLYPFLRRWPTPSPTAETLLVRREGDEVVFLNELRFQRGWAFGLRRPLSDTQLPAARAALGLAGVTEGIDYRGVPVLAAIGVVPDSPWRLVARVDVEEIEGPLRDRLWTLAAFGALTLLAGAAGLGLVWRQQGLTAARERYRAAEELNESLARFRLVVESTNDAVYEWDLRDRVEWSSRVDGLLGYDPGEFPRTLVAWREALHPEDRDRVMDAVAAQLATSAAYSIEYRIGARDAGWRWWSARGAAVRLPDGTPTRWVGTITDITDRRRREEELAESRQLLLDVTDNSTALIYIIDSEGRFVLANEKLCQLFGLERRQFLGQTRQAVMPAEAAAQHRANDLKVLSERRPTLCEESNPEADGIHTYLTLKYPLFAKDGTANAVGGMSTDVTDRRRAEDALRESESFLDSVFEHSPHAMWLSDRKGTMVRLNQACRDLLRITDAEVVGKYNVLQDNIVAAQGHLPAVRRVFEQGERARFTIDYGSAELAGLELRQHVSLVLDVTMSAVRDADGRVAHAIVQHVDITERVRAQDALRESTTRYRRLHESMRDAFVLVDLSGRILETNPAYRELVGYEEEELAGLSYEDLTPERWHAFESRLVEEQVLPNGHSEVYEKEYVRKDGRTLPVELRTFLLRGESGEPAGLWAIVRDITQRKRAEAEILQLNAELEQRVAERTARLEAANQELEAFSYSVSHDLRAPLRHIDGYVGLLLEHCRAGLDEQGRHYLDTVADSARQMSRLIDDLLQLSRTGRTEMHETGVDMTKLLREARDSLETDCTGRRIEWVLGELPSVRGDRSMLRVVWVNLLGNAVKYTRTRPQARIEVGAREDEGEATFFVRDDGVGFDMRYAHKLFGVFQRLHPASEFEGTGIGLATVRRIVTRHGGRTWAEAQLGAGAAFYFSLPRSRGER